MESPNRTTTNSSESNSLVMIGREIYGMFPHHRVNVTWPNYRQMILVDESIKMGFFVFLLVFIVLICCKECGLCERPRRRLSNCCPCCKEEEQESATPLTEAADNRRGSDTMVTVADVQQHDDRMSTRAAGDCV